MKFIFVHPLRDHAEYAAQFMASNDALTGMGLPSESFEEWFAHGLDGYSAEHVSEPEQPALGAFPDDR